MFNTTTRGRLQAAGALMISIMLIWAVALFGGSSASAQAQPVPANTPVTITKLSQPGTLGNAATGESASVPTGAERIGGVVFDYYLLPGYDMGTNKGQEDAAALTVTPTVTGEATGSFTATSPAGETTKTLDRGLYVVVERASTVPAGVTASAPFMLTVPMTDPTDLDAWLDHIYVYPKNSLITVTKTVQNATDYVVGDTVTWTAEAGIPRVENPAYDGTNDEFIAPDSFRIDEVFNNAQINLVNGYTAGNNPGIVVTAGTETLIEGTEYNITPIDTGGYRIELTPEGLAKLATQVNADPNAKVTVTIDTTVLTPGQITSTTDVYPNANAVTQERPARASAEIRYGNYNFQKLSSDSTVADLSGAEFRVYATVGDAEADTNPLAPVGGGHTGGIWTTNADGEISITGLRYSNWSNGISVSGDGYVTYYLVETKALDGHQLLAAPVPFVVTAETGGTSPDWVADQEITNQANTGAFVLPLTGGSGTAMLTIAGIAILAVVLFVARRRSAA